MAVYALTSPKEQWLDANGNPYVGAKLFTYSAGTTTKKTTYTEADGLIANANPIILNSRGEPPSSIFGTTGAYDLVLAPSTDTDPPTSIIWTARSVPGINDTAAAAVTEWAASGFTPTFINATSFSVPGDQTGTLQIGRRLKTVNSGGTIYSTITNSVFGAVTTVTVVNDSGVLDSGISAVSYGILAASNPSAPTITGLAAFTAVDPSADSVAMLDASTGQMVRVLTQYIAAPSLTAAVATTSGTSKDITIPFPCNRFTVSLKGTSTNGANVQFIQLGIGAASFGGTTYSGKVFNSSTAATASWTGGVAMTNVSGPGITITGCLEFRLESASTNTWMVTGNVGDSTSIYPISGQIVLAGVLTTVRFTSNGGVDTLDAGEFSVLVG